MGAGSANDHLFGRHLLFRAFSASKLQGHRPRALPWADTFRTFGAGNRSFSQSLPRGGTDSFIGPLDLGDKVLLRFPLRGFAPVLTIKYWRVSSQTC